MKGSGNFSGPIPSSRTASIEIVEGPFLIQSRTPFRISFFGGGTDYPEWFRENGGKTLGTTINKYCHTYIYHPGDEGLQKVDVLGKKRTQVLTVVKKFLRIKQPLTVGLHNDLPCMSGIGSSSSFTVGLLHSLWQFKGRVPSKHHLAMQSIHIEQELLKEVVGGQDQVFAAHGGMRLIEFGRDGNIEAHPLPCDPQRKKIFNDHLMLFFTGKSRFSSVNAQKIIRGIKHHRPELTEMMEMVDEARKILLSQGDLSELGRLLHYSWQRKKRLAKTITNSDIDRIYERARSAGALGGKILGAGGGGFQLFFVTPEKKESVRQALFPLQEVPFQFENGGSTILSAPAARDARILSKDDIDLGTFPKSQNPHKPGQGPHPLRRKGDAFGNLSP